MEVGEAQTKLGVERFDEVVVQGKDLEGSGVGEQLQVDVIERVVVQEELLETFQVADVLRDGVDGVVYDGQSFQITIFGGFNVKLDETIALEIDFGQVTDGDQKLSDGSVVVHVE